LKTRQPKEGRKAKELILASVARWSEINASRLAAALSFYTMLSIAPLLVVSIAIAGAVFGEQAARGQIVWQIQNLVGTEGGKAIQALLEDARRPDAGLVAGVIGIVTLLFGASGVFVELQEALNLIWDVHAQRSAGLKGMVLTRFASFAIVLGVGFLLLVSLVVSAAIAGTEHFFRGLLPIPGSLLDGVNAGIGYAGILLAFALLYRIVPDVRIEWRDVWTGAAVTAALFSIGKFLIGVYIGKAAFGSTYGAAGSLVIFLVWVYYSAQIFYFGAVFTREFARRQGSQARNREARSLKQAGVPGLSRVQEGGEIL